MLTPGEAAIAAQALDAWLEDYEAATDQVIADRGLQTPEQLLEAVESIHEDFADATAARAKLRLMAKAGVT